MCSFQLKGFFLRYKRKACEYTENKMVRDAEQGKHQDATDMQTCVNLSNGALPQKKKGGGVV